MFEDFIEYKHMTILIINMKSYVSHSIFIKTVKIWIF